MSASAPLPPDQEIIKQLKQINAQLVGMSRMLQAIQTALQEQSKRS